MTDNNRESFTFEIVEHICKLGQTREDGFTKEFNRVSFRGLPPKWDIREWNHNHTRMTKGITLTDSEMALMLDALAERKERLRALREKREAAEMQKAPASEAAEEHCTPPQETAEEHAPSVQEPEPEPVSAPDSEDVPASVLDSDDEYVPSHDANLF